jgi:cysteine-S-conjugate beta-lyase
MTDYVDAVTLKSWLSDGREIALFDVREHGQYGEGHLFFAVPLPYSAFEPRLVQLAPNFAVRLVLYDNGDGIAERAAKRAKELGFSNINILSGGAAVWEKAGFTLYAGVNVPSKTMGELIEADRHTPHVSAGKLKAMSEAGENFVIVDGRPFAEFHEASIPGGVCCPNGELALRIDDIAPDPETMIVVNCAGRTRSIIGAETLIDLGIANPVVALENGTQGWSLAGFDVETGATRRYPKKSGSEVSDARRVRVRALAELRGARFVDEPEIATWLEDKTRTTYLIDIRSHEEYAEDGSPRFTHAPGGQFIQATDRWIGVRGARIVVADSECIRAPVIAAWLRQLGHEAYVMAGGGGDVGKTELSVDNGLTSRQALPAIEAAALQALDTENAVQIIDVRSSMKYRDGHIAGAIWSIRPNVASLAGDKAKTIVLVAEQADIAELCAIDLGEAGAKDIRLLEGDIADWRDANLNVVATPDMPADAECIDFLFFTHRRHQGDAEHSRQYLAWEVGLIGQLDEQERASFKIVPAPAL